MKMFQVNLKGEKKGHIFDTVAAAYNWVCENAMTQGDVDFYKEIGNVIPLNQIHDETIQEVVLRNSFEKVGFTGWNDDAYDNSSYFIIH